MPFWLVTIIGLSILAVGVFKVLNMSNNVCQLVRGLLGWPDKLLWLAELCNLILSVSEQHNGRIKEIGLPTN